ncbi:MAG TPA: pyrroloquinoline quinone biosynthesis protein PqqE [Polyangiaceae bacterium]|nr:pyrroloquinoline quinone biosynthesis protein PqqE [Polyangiaceae bacterium]
MAESSNPAGASNLATDISDPRAYTLIAELTYRCPLRCPYCSNPVDFRERKDELSTADWLRVLREAEELGVLQVNFSGGEPLLRDDLEQFIAEAKRLDLYQNLITSGLPLTRERLQGLVAAGLNGLQLSIQDSDRAGSEHIAGCKSYDHKLQVAAWVKELGLPLTVNCVLHRENLRHVSEIVALAERLGADRLELANAQYLGFALQNREALLPSRELLAEARAIAAREKQRLQGKMELLFVLPDYYSDRPKSCMNGWGRRYLLVTPDGLALPCHLAHTLPGLEFENVRERSLEELWNSSGFRAYRGQDWMQEPCRSCDRRHTDFGGCRCQAFYLTGDATATDPVCSLSPEHGRILQARERSETESGLVPLRYRGAIR